MSREEGKREIVFQMTMSAARQMLEKGLISEDEYKQFDTKMQQKYCPIFGTLFSYNIFAGSPTASSRVAIQLVA